ncbi:MAG: hypothetical protein K0S67_30 [Nitrososphaeraceae archaeon]|jgi:hypothetical protein|nr:hypothetical protein [Nitrososphaeraceae archaeon]
MVDDIINQLLRMESEKCDAFRLFNKLSFFELGDITYEQYLTEEKEIMRKSIEEMKNIYRYISPVSTEKLLYDIL